MKKIQFLFFPLLLCLALPLLLRSVDPAQLWKDLSACSLGYLLAAAACILFFQVCEAVNLHRCLQLASSGCGAAPAEPGGNKKRTRIRSCGQAFFYALTGFFFSGITPFASGGQPMQLYRMHRNGIPTACGTAALAMELASFQAASVLLAGIGLLFFSSFVLQTSGLAASLLLLGFTANLVLLSVLLLAVFLPDILGRVLDAAARLLQRLHLPGAGHFREAAGRWAADYRGCASCLRTAPKRAVLLLLTSLLQLAALHSIPYWIALSLGVHSVSLLQITAMQAVLFLVVSLIPLPGGTGASEGGFLLFYAPVFAEGCLESAMLLSRFASFYLPMAVCGILLLAADLPARRKK